MNCPTVGKGGNTTDMHNGQSKLCMLRSGGLDSSAEALTSLINPLLEQTRSNDLGETSGDAIEMHNDAANHSSTNAARFFVRLRCCIG